MSRAVAADGARASEAVTVTALFDSREAVDQAIERLHGVGVPRDLVEVVVSPAAAARFYSRVRGERRWRQALHHAGTGALVGLIVGALVSLALVAVPGFADVGRFAIVQLLGPNFGLMSGALIGVLIGLLVPRRPSRRHRRAAEAPSAIVVAVTSRTGAEAEIVAGLLVAAGGREPRIEP